MRRIRDAFLAFAAIILLLIIFLITPSLSKWQEHKALENPQYVHLTLRQDSEKITSILSPCTLWIGATQNFLFLLAKKDEAPCQSPQKQETSSFDIITGKLREDLAFFVFLVRDLFFTEESDNRGESNDENRRLLIVPKANVASLEFNPPPPSETPNPPSPDTGREAQCYLEEFQSIGPFESGQHGQPTSALQTQLDKLVEDWKKAPEKHTLQQLILIGRVDIQQLSEEERQFYGSDSGLAQARAEWVWERLEKKLEEKKVEIDRKRVILLSAGPRHVGQASDDDRSVEVYACWTPKPTASSADSGA